MGFFYYGKTRPKIHSPKMNKFYLNTDITTSNGDLSIEKFMDQLTNYDKVIEYMMQLVEN